MISIPQALEMAWKHFRAGQLQEAEQLYRQILQVDPNQVDAWHLLGVIAAQTGRYGLAIECLSAALRLQPDLAQAHNNLGNVFASRRQWSAAVASYQQALRARPDYTVAHNGLGNALREQGLLVEAEASFRQAVRLQPDYAEAHGNLGLVLAGLDRLAEAETELHQALHLGHPSSYASAHLHSNLGKVLGDQGRLDEALAAYRAALQLRPDAARIHSNLIFAMHYHPGYDAAAVRDECRRWNQQHAEPLQKFILPHSNLPDPERRLRIGYVSPDFRWNATASFTIPLLSHHDRQQFEIFCYADVACPDALTERLRGLADGWRDSAGLSDQQVADLVRSDQIDCLVDLSMHTAYNRLLLFARKPAPVQVSWLAYPGTTGLTAIDYRLTDP
jgi:protein O-GlcNAc transferase